MLKRKLLLVAGILGSFICVVTSFAMEDDSDGSCSLGRPKPTVMSRDGSTLDIGSSTPKGAKKKGRWVALRALFSCCSGVSPSKRVEEQGCGNRGVVPPLVPNATSGAQDQGAQDFTDIEEGAPPQASSASSFMRNQLMGPRVLPASVVRGFNPRGPVSARIDMGRYRKNAVR